MPDPDTIVALGTPPGISALAVIRLSGTRAISIASRLCPQLPARPDERRAFLVKAVDPETGQTLDRVLVTLFPGPESYTGEDMAELSCHGGWLSPSLVVESCVRAGARRAEGGEFTRRAFLNGKMDLLQAEAVLDVIEGRSRALHGAAVCQLERGLSLRIGALREGLVELEALLVHHLDFPEEDDPPVSVTEILGQAALLAESMERLLSTAPEGELLREGALTVLAGRPNTGKSSLFNALLGVERAIVTDVPGTTRDALEAVASLGGFPFRLVDTAGLRESGERVEQVGIEVARRYLRDADLVLFCAEEGRELSRDECQFLAEQGTTPVVLVRTMLDRMTPGERGDEGGSGVGRRLARASEQLREGGILATVSVSAATGEGLERLQRLLPSLVYGGLVGMSAEVPVLTRRRHAEGVRVAMDEVRAFGEALATGVPAEAAATHLRPAETALEEVLGVIPREEILDRVFGEFCIGK